MNQVLILEDQPRMRRVLQILVEKVGAAPYCAQSAEVALVICSEQRIDLVLSDLKMAPIDGLEFLRRLRSLGCDVPVIILTALGTISTAVEAMKLGAFDYLQKPFDNEALEIVIRKALDFSLHRVEGHAHFN
jgi:DNA-binding NtrC family response regulator